MTKILILAAALFVSTLTASPARAQHLKCDPKRLEGNAALLRNLELRVSHEDNSKLTFLYLRLDCPAGGALTVIPHDTRYIPFAGGRIERVLEVISRKPTGKGDAQDVTVRLTLRGEGQGFANPKTRIEGTEFRITWVERRSASDEADGRIGNPLQSVQVQRRTYVRQGKQMLGGTDFRGMVVHKGEARAVVGAGITESFPVR